MRFTTLALCAASAALALAGCNRQDSKPAPAPTPVPASAPAPSPAASSARPPVTGFAHSGNFDNAGYYMPTRDLRVGPWQLKTIGVGAISDFSAWEQGDRTSTFGPILLEFDDTSSPLKPNDLGNEVHAVSVRVLPSGYATDGKTLRFAGLDPRLGPVTFEGAFDPAAMAEAKAQGASEAAVLTGILQVGETRIDNARFTFFAGE
ncbi:MAG: hypothetical protein Q7T61_16765 [Caulobacter sp.]|nr:hypothetical protein [Caulobacter sp.]